MHDARYPRFLPLVKIWCPNPPGSGVSISVTCISSLELKNQGGGVGGSERQEVDFDRI